MHQPTTVFHLARSSRTLVTPLVLLLIVAFVVLGLVRLLGRQDQPIVDTSAAYGAAKAAGVFPVASPSRLPEGWRALTSDFQQAQPAAVLRIVLRAPGGGAVQLVQSAWQPQSLLTTELGGHAKPQGTVDVAGSTWQRYLGEGGMLALVLFERGRTIIVVGTVSERDLRGLAGSLTV